MKLFVTHIIISCILLLSTSTYAQTAVEILEKVNETYYQKAYQMHYTITGYNVDKQVYHYSGQVAKSGAKQLSKSDYEVTLINDAYFLHVNHDRKIVVVNELDKQKKAKKNDVDIMESLDSIIEQSHPKLTSKTRSLYQIELKQEESPYYETIFLTINKKYELIGVSYYTKTADNGLTKIDVTYQNLKIAETLSNSYFSIEDYVIISKKNIIAKEKYKSYEIVDQRQFQKEK